MVCGILAARGEGLGGNLDDVVDARQGLVMSSAQCQRGRSALPHELRPLPEHGRHEEDLQGGGRLVPKLPLVGPSESPLVDFDIRVHLPKPTARLLLVRSLQWVIYMAEKKTGPNEWRQ